jgi:hypothetical protein
VAPIDKLFGGGRRQIAACDLAVHFRAVGGLDPFALDTLRGCADLGLRRRADHGGKLAEAPVGRCEWHIRARHDQRQPFRIVPACLHANCRALRGPRPASFGSAGYGAEQIRQGQIAFVGGTREPFRGNTPDSFAPAHTDLESAALVASGVRNIKLTHGISP